MIRPQPAWIMWGVAARAIRNGAWASINDVVVALNFKFGKTLHIKPTSTRLIPYLGEAECNRLGRVEDFTGVNHVVDIIEGTSNWTHGRGISRRSTFRDYAVSSDSILENEGYAFWVATVDGRGLLQLMSLITGQRHVNGRSAEGNEVLGYIEQSNISINKGEIVKTQ